jgi:ABC-type sulfate transport system substrate-binding protein
MRYRHDALTNRPYISRAASNTLGQPPSAHERKNPYRFLFSDEAQEILAEDGYRPENADVLARHPSSPTGGRIRFTTWFEHHALV